MIANKKVAHIADLRAEKAYADRDPWIVTGVELGGVRTVLMVPMLKENKRHYTRAASLSLSGGKKNLKSYCDVGRRQRAAKAKWCCCLARQALESLD